MLVVKRIHVTYYLKADAEQMDKIDRAHKFHAKNCPVARTIWDCVDITTSLELV